MAPARVELQRTVAAWVAAIPVVWELGWVSEVLSGRASPRVLPPWNEVVPEAEGLFWVFLGAEVLGAEQPVAAGWVPVAVVLVPVAVVLVPTAVVLVPAVVVRIPVAAVRVAVVVVRVPVVAARVLAVAQRRVVVVE